MNDTLKVILTVAAIIAGFSLLLLSWALCVAVKNGDERLLQDDDRRGELP